MPKINKNLLLVLVLLVVAVAGFFIFQFVGGDPEPLTSSQPGFSSPIGQELIIELNRLTALKNVKSDLFKNPAFASLRDLTQQVAPQPVGRGNPFAPIGSGQ